MQKAIIGKKVGMTQIFDESGKVIPVTVVEAGPCVVTQKKTVETDGYTAVQLGFGDVKESKLTKPEAGHLKKAGVAPQEAPEGVQAGRRRRHERGRRDQGRHLRRRRQDRRYRHQQGPWLPGRCEAPRRRPYPP